MVSKKSVKKNTSFKGDSNPFNVKLNREKHCVLGKKVKGTRGLRCISQAQSMVRRKEAFHKKKKALGKANSFMDKRLMTGESAEENAVSRLVHERKSKLKKNIFNLNDDDFLTHEGVPLDHIEIFDHKAKDSDDDEPLSSDYLQKAHFGNLNSGSGEDKPFSHKEIIEQMIADSKQKKYEMKKEKDMTADLIDQLDLQWKSFHGSTKIKADVKKIPTKTSDYDLVAQQLKYCARGKATSRTKTPEEIQAEEKKKQLQLEEERVLRMLDKDSTATAPTEHVSADSICDDFVFEPIVSMEDTVPDNAKNDDDSDNDLGPNNESDEDDDDDDNEGGDEEDESVEGDEVDETNEDGLEDDLADFNIPKTVEEFEEYMEEHNYTPEKSHEAVEEFLKPVLNSKSEKKLEKLSKFFSSLIEYALKNLRAHPCVSQNLAPSLYQLAEISPLKCAESFLFFLDVLQKEFQESKDKKNKCKFQIQRAILIFKYCSVLYSVSDFRHPVVTPSFILMCDILSSQFPVDYSNVVGRLCICHIVLKSVSLSRRFVPDVVSFLNKILSSAVPCELKSANTKTKKKSPLLLTKKYKSSDVIELNALEPQVLRPSNKVSIVLQALDLLLKFSELYKDLPSFREIFEESVQLCSKLPAEYYPPQVTQVIEDLSKVVHEERSRVPLTYPNVKPKPLKLFEPNFDCKLTKRDTIKKQFRELKQVNRKIRKEEKGLLREIRRDVQVVASEKLKERLSSDAERKRKVQELYHDLAEQQGEYNKLMKLKKKK